LELADSRLEEPKEGIAMTEMTASLLEIIERLLRRQRSPIRATRQFRSWKHDADILPRLQTQLDTVLVALKKFEPIVYNTQGILDAGTDITIRYRTSNQGDEEREIIGFQVKSYDDLSEPDYMKILKAQSYDSLTKVHNLRYYFILLCTDAEEHRKKIQNINAEFRSSPLTKVIEPRFAYTFLSSPSTTAEAFVKRTMQEGDIVLIRALESLSHQTQTAQSLAIFLAVKAVLAGGHEFTECQVLEDATLKRMYRKLLDEQTLLIEGAFDDNDDVDGDPPYTNGEDGEENYTDESEMTRIAEFGTQVPEDLALLENDLIERSSGSNNFVLMTDQLRALYAVIADALARYEYTEDELMSYMFSVMRVTD
jgi:hypothetical protein